MDTTQDIPKVDQLSIAVSCAIVTKSENGQPFDVKVKEALLNFYAVFEHGAADLVKQVITFFIDKNFNLKKYVGQIYDGASVMSGVYNGVQKQIEDIQPNTKIVLKSSGKRERSQAENIKTKMQNFEHLLLCEFMHRVLNDINDAFKTTEMRYQIGQGK
ncbi:hypothetical protein EVAR_20436_1 [Eumeta japonica]|uniref:DUF4371 domain-containing protein n=1 Tax=Eumeta variegata TaxID=151549 RepID=A0A4C1TYK2_EUMVA|nr:hypothetical protein EVAR_20436_1 [Eumeta japonica]